MKKIIAVLLMSVLMLCSISLTVFAESEKIDVWVNIDGSGYKHTSDDEARVIAALSGFYTPTSNKYSSNCLENENANVYDLSNIADDLYLINVNYSDGTDNYKAYYLTYVKDNNIEIVDKLIKTFLWKESSNRKEFMSYFNRERCIYNNISSTGIDVNKYPVIIYDREYSKSGYKVYGTSRDGNQTHVITSTGFKEVAFKAVDEYYRGVYDSDDKCSYITQPIKDNNLVNRNILSNGDKINTKLVSYRSASAVNYYNLKVSVFDNSDAEKYEQVVHMYTPGETENSSVIISNVITDDFVELFSMSKGDVSPGRYGYLLKVQCVKIGTDSGIRNIAAVKEADTVPHQNSVNFNDDEIPLAYDLKSGVVDEDKLSEDLKARFKNIEDSSNAILLPKIVFIKGSGSKTITYKTGQTFKDSNSYTDSSMGGSITAKITNAGVFTYTCSNTSALQAGTYNKQYVFDDKMVYVQVIVLAQPSANTSVTINF